jgi:hypothetical protein
VIFAGKATVFSLLSLALLCGQAAAQRVGGPPGAGSSAVVTPTNDRYGDLARPDLSGVWSPGRMGMEAGPPVPLTKPYIAKLDEIRRRTDAGDVPATSVSRCIAMAMPRFMTMEFESIQTPGQLTLINRVLNDVRRIYIDGRGHSKDFDPTYNGDSIARWEGDTLVVETNNLLAGTMDEYGIPYSDKMSIVERFKRTSPTTMQVSMTMTDSEALTRPYTMIKNFNLQPAGARLESYACENNRNDVGGGTMGAAVGILKGGK